MKRIATVMLIFAIISLVAASTLVEASGLAEGNDFGLGRSTLPGPAGESTGGDYALSSQNYQPALSPMSGGEFSIQPALVPLAASLVITEEVWRPGFTVETANPVTPVYSDSTKGRVVGIAAAFRSDRSSDTYFIFPAPANLATVKSAKYYLLSRNGSYADNAIMTLETFDYDGSFEHTVSAAGIDMETAATGDWTDVTLSDTTTDLEISSGEFLAFHLNFSGGASGNLDIRPVFEVEVELNSAQPDLIITKAVDPATIAAPGQAITYTLVFTNKGGDTPEGIATGVVITDIMPVTLTNVSVVSSGVNITDSGANPAFVWNVQDLARNEGGIITITGQIDPGLTSHTRLTNTAYINASNADSNTQDNSAQAGLDVYHYVDLDIAKTVNPTIAEPGQVITYSLVFTNQGPGVVTRVVITDTVPVSVAVQSVISSGDVAITRTLNSRTAQAFETSAISSGEGGVITITGVLSSPLAAESSLINTAVITSTAIDIDSANNSDSAMVTVSNVAPVANSATYATNEDTPLHQKLSANDSNGNNTLTYGIFTNPITGSVTITNPAGGGFIYTPTNQAATYVDIFTFVVTDTGGLTDTAMITITVDADVDADMVITKSVHPTAAVLGQTITYSLVFTNNGPDTAFGVIITDIVPPEIDPIGLQKPPGLSITPTGSISYVWQIEDLSPDEMGAITLTGQISGNLNAGTIFTNTTLITATVVDADTGNNRAKASLTVVAPEMAVMGNGQEIANGDTTPITGANTDFGNALVAGGQITHTFTISNSGAGNLNLTGTPHVTLTTGVHFNVGAQPAAGTIDGGNTITFQVRFSPAAIGSFQDTVNISSNDSDESPYTFVISGTGTAPNLSIVKSVTPTSVIAGEFITYTIAFSNVGDETARGVVITDHVPITITNVVTSSHGATITPTGSLSFAWTVENLSVGEDGIITITGQVNPGLANDTTFTNTATITHSTGSGQEVDTNNNSDEVGVEVTTIPNLVVSKTDSDDPAQAGAILTYTLRVTNTSPGTALEVLITDTLPASATFVSALGGSCNQSGNKVICTPLNILLVDDDDDAPDVRPYYESALNALGYSNYTVFDVDDAGNGPDAAAMASYNLVIWFSGEQFNGSGPNSIDETELTAYLAGGGKLLLSSQDYYSGLGLTSFMRNQLGVAGVIDNIGATNPVNGINNFAGLGPYMLNFPPSFSDFADGLTANITGTAAFKNSSGFDIAIDTANTVFLAFPWETIQNGSAVNGQNTMRAIVEHLSPTAGSLKVNQLAAITLTAIVDPAASGVITNTVEAGSDRSDLQPLDNTAVETTTILAATGVGISKTVTPTLTAAGEVITYTLTFSNSGSVAAAGVVITDTPPVPTVTVTGIFSSGVIITQTGSSPVYTFDVANLAPGEGGIITMTAIVSATLGQGVSFTNTAQITTTTADADINNSAAVVAATKNFNVGASKRVDKEKITTGMVLTYTVIITNQGTGSVVNTTMSDTIPVGAVYVPNSLTTQGSPLASFNGSAITWAGTMAGEEAIVFTYRVTTTASSGYITNTAIVSYADLPVSLTPTVISQIFDNQDYLYTNETDRFIPPSACSSQTSSPIVVPDSFVVGDVRVGVNLTHNERQNFEIHLVDPSGTVSTTLLVKGTGGADENIDILFDDAGGTDYTGNHNTGTPFYDNVLKPTGPGTLSDFEGVNAQGSWTLVSCNNGAAISEGILNQWSLFFDTADMALSKTVTPTAVFPGDSITYTLTFSKSGSSAVSGVVITDAIPTGVTALNVISSGVTITQTGNAPTYIWQVQNLTQDATGYITITAQIDSSTGPGVLTNTATVTALQDNDVDNNTAEAGLTVIAPEITVIGNGQAITAGDTTPTAADHTDFGDVLVIGGQVTRTFTVSNSGTYSLTLSGTPRVGLSGPTSGSFSVTGQPSSTVTAGNTTTFTIMLDPAATGLLTATATITNNDGDENPYTFVISGIGGAPEIAVIGNGQVITDGDTTPSAADYTDFGRTLAVGGMVTRTFTISNSGNTNLNLTGTPYITLTTGVHFNVSAPPAISAIGNDSTTTFQITFAPSTVGAFQDTVNISNDDADEAPYTFAISGTGTSTILSIGKSAQAMPNNSAVNYHSLITYTVTITNSGNGDASGLIFTDTLQNSSVEFARFVTPPTPGNTGESGDIITWSGTVTANSVITFSYVVTHVGNYGDFFFNVAQFLHPTTSQTGTAVSVIRIASGPDMNIDKSSTPVNAAPGETITYTLIFSNVGGSPAAGIVITDQVPTNLTNLNVVSSTNFGGSISDAGAVPAYVWNVSDMDAGDSGGITITGQISQNLTVGGKFTNTTEITATASLDINPNNNLDRDNGVNIIQSDLTITKTVNNAWPNGGETITYTVIITNNGPDTVDNVQIRDTLPVSVTLSAVDQSDGVYNAATGIWSGFGSPLTSGNSYILTLTTVVTDAAGALGQQIVNTAVISQFRGINLNNNDDTATVSIALTGADLEVAKMVSDNTPAEQQLITYTVVITNNGPDDTASVVANDALPDSIVFGGLTVSKGNYERTTGEWTISSGLSQGEVATLTITGTVISDSAGQTITNTASIGSSAENDPRAGNNSASAALTVQFADLALSKLVYGAAGTAPGSSSAIVDEGESITYTIIISNPAGPNDAPAGTIISDTLPSGVTLQGAQASSGTVTLPGSNQIKWTAPQLSVGDVETLIVTATVDADTGAQTINNTAFISATTIGDSMTLDNTAVASITVNGADLNLNKTASSVWPMESETITYTIVVANNGPSTATGIVVSDTLPAGISFGEAVLVSQGSYIPGTPGLWNVGTLAKNSVVTLAMTATVDSGTTGQTLVNTAAISDSSPADGIYDNNIDSVSVTVQNSDLSINKKVADRNNEELNGVITYTLTIKNSGPTVASGAIISDIMPTGVTTFTWSCTSSSGGANCPGSDYLPGSINQTIGQIPVDGQLVYTIRATLVSSDTVVTNTATVTTLNGLGDPDGSNNQSVIVSRPIEYIYLPLIYKNAGPDLEIENLEASAGAITVTIRNVGSMSVINDFWVDVYFDPRKTPTINQPWDNIADSGAVWGVTANIPANGIITLTVGDAYYYENFSSTPPFPVGVPVYGFVDSINYDTNYGNVWEIDEDNNLFGPVISSAGDAALNASGAESFPAANNLPVR